MWAKIYLLCFTLLAATLIGGTFFVQHYTVGIVVFLPGIASSAIDHDRFTD